MLPADFVFQWEKDRREVLGLGQEESAAKFQFHSMKVIVILLLWIEFIYIV